MMGICGSKTEEEKISSQIDKELVEDGKKHAKDCKILLLGAGESGKSTIVKQMKIIHLNGFTPQALLFFRPVIYRNLVESAQDIILAMKKLGIDFVEPANRANAERVFSYIVDSDPSFVIDPSITTAIEALINDGAMPALMEESHKFYLMDNADYFFQAIKRIGAPDYIPNETDVLRARAKTTGITETKFNLGPMSIQMFDVGGQRSERKKWIHCFENVTSIIFCVAISEYDQVLLEEASQNRMDESLILFESVVDVFKSKIRKSPLERHFPEYTGGADINKAAKYLLWRFQQVNRKQLMIYPHLTQATDTTNVRLVFAAVKETLLQNALRESGIL
ncbi:Guanine nucleotide-binding protein alpha-2 subunit [Tulasnella sp. 425]|nr:Guanine nucleotide-binding protein alpha-2 subunit [Tulasnella sp. 425]